MGKSAWVLGMMMALVSSAQGAEPSSVEHVKSLGRARFERLYRAPDPSQRITGACLTNARDLARTLIGSHRVPEEELRMLWIDGQPKAGGRGGPIGPRREALRESEVAVGERWMNHVALITADQRVFDLSADASLWGTAFRTYGRAMFAHSAARPSQVRFVHGPLKRLFEYGSQHDENEGSVWANPRHDAELATNSGGGMTTRAELEQAAADSSPFRAPPAHAVQRPAGER